MRIDFDIAGLTVRLTNLSDEPAHGWPLAPFDRFLLDDVREPEITITVEIVSSLPPAQGLVRFDACHGLWRLYDAPGGAVIESLDTTTHVPRLIAFVEDGYRRVRAWTLPHVEEGRTGWAPMHILNPVGEICLITRLARTGGCMLHAAGIATPRGGYVFTGPSGAGKSTISHSFAEQGFPVLSDERVALRRTADGAVVYGTPWVGSGRYAANAMAPLAGLFGLRHGADHRLSPFLPGSFMSTVLSQCFLPHWDRAAMNDTLAFIARLFAHVPHADLAFAKRDDVVTFLDRHVPAMSLA